MIPFFFTFKKIILYTLKKNSLLIILSISGVLGFWGFGVWIKVIIAVPGDVENSLVVLPVSILGHS